MKNYWLDKKMERDVARAPVFQDEPWTYSLVDDDDQTAAVVQGIINGSTTVTCPVQTGGSVTISADIPTLDLGGGTITVDGGCAGGDCQCFTFVMECNGQFFTVADSTVVMPAVMVPPNFNESCWFAANGPNRGFVPNITDVYKKEKSNG